MATSYYSTGTVSLINGSPVVTGVGTLWQTALITNGFLFIEAAEGNPLPIASVDSDSQITAELEWTGATGTYSYALLRQPDQLQDNAENSRALSYLLSELRNGTIFKYDMSGTLADRALYNERPKGFSYLVLAGSNAQLYVKASAASGDWAGPFAYGAGPVGPMGPAGFVNFRGTYSAGTTYVRNDGVHHNGSSWVALQTTTGNSPPNLPTTENAYWSLLAVKGQDGTGIGDMLKAIYDPQNRQLPFATVADAGIVAGFRNKIINGKFDHWLRSTVITVGSRHATGWYTDFVGSTTVSQAPVGPEFGPGRPDYCVRIQRTVAASNNNIVLGCAMLNAKRFLGKAWTTTIWHFNVGGANKSFNVRPIVYFGDGGSPVQDLGGSTFTALAGAGWQKFTYVFDMPAFSSETFGPNSYVAFRILEESNLSTFDVAFTHISFVEGDATMEFDPFAERSNVEEELLCKQFYQQLPPLTVSAGMSANTFAFVPPMAKVPTLSWTRTAGDPSQSLAIYNLTRHGFRYTADNPTGGLADFAVFAEAEF